ncbi:hypothetical protein HMPREF9141_1509 [Prevotella multiformis DSM 16608]|uniref:Uncharacterized protein n=1 Tax=Prevotella multiformis DSM 16608 TaxID=888743 RepID=F0F7E2_9BACT|nr:hypothetical protein HMPREF9141_1509 [Prevotella multiformis DSM 16608]
MNIRTAETEGKQVASSSQEGRPPRHLLPAVTKDNGCKTAAVRHGNPEGTMKK